VLSAGMTLRIVDSARFEMVYSMDNWKTNTRLEARSVGYAGYFADIPTAAGEGGTIRFTFHWPGQDKWLGKNFEVTVEE
jgi:glucoamylase